MQRLRPFTTARTPAALRRLLSSTTLAATTPGGPEGLYVATVALDDAVHGTPLAKQYRRVQNPDGTLDNVMRAHSLNPESLRAHADLYFQAMKGRESALSLAEREMVAVHVSQLNRCT